jgi:hypothetical protein
VDESFDVGRKVEIGAPQAFDGDVICTAGQWLGKPVAEPQDTRKEQLSRGGNIESTSRGVVDGMLKRPHRI